MYWFGAILTCLQCDFIHRVISWCVFWPLHCFMAYLVCLYYMLIWGYSDMLAIWFHPPCYKLMCILHLILFCGLLGMPLLCADLGYSDTLAIWFHPPCYKLMCIFALTLFYGLLGMSLLYADLGYSDTLVIWFYPPCYKLMCILHLILFYGLLGMSLLCADLGLFWHACNISYFTNKYAVCDNKRIDTWVDFE